MELQDAIKLISHPGLTAESPTIWADFGSGSELFTNALATFLKPGSKIYPIDEKANVFKTPRVKNEVTVEGIIGDFTKPLPILDLDGILMANSLHFVSDKISFLKECTRYFKKHELFLIVEYNTDSRNPWIPYPVSFASLNRLFLSLGFSSVEKIRDVPSRYHGEIYSALVRR